MKPLGITALGLSVIIIITAWIFFFIGQAVEHHRQMKAEKRYWDKLEEEEWRKENAHKSVNP